MNTKRTAMTQIQGLRCGSVPWERKGLQEQLGQNRRVVGTVKEAKRLRGAATGHSKEERGRVMMERHLRDGRNSERVGKRWVFEKTVPKNAKVYCREP